MPNEVYRIRRDDGTRGFLCPPGHPNLTYSVHIYYPRGNATPSPARRREPDGIQSLDSFANDENVPEERRAGARRLLANAKLTCSELYVRNVYGYFRNSYAPESGDRNVSNAVFYSPTCVSCGKLPAKHAGEDHEHQPVPRPPATRHLAYLAVREYFPDHAPREDLITDPGKGYGSYPCIKCGKRVQYEARADALCEVVAGMRWHYDAKCPQGGKHEVP